MNAIDDIVQIQNILKPLFPEVKADGDIGKITTAAVQRLKVKERVQKIQSILVRWSPRVIIDGKVGKYTLEALNLLDELGDLEELNKTKGKVQDLSKTVKASSFADPADVRAFAVCKAKGNSDLYCFAKGDNGIGKWGHLCAQEEEPMAALPREVWRLAGKTGGAKLAVTYKGVRVEGILGDTMPSLSNIKNGCGIDLNPAFAKALGTKPPFMLKNVTWEWIS